MTQSPREPQDKDRVLADTGWGVKPDAQPGNKDEVRDAQTAFQHDPTNPGSVAEAIRVQQRNFNTARRVIVEPQRTRIVDINRDEFVIEGLSFGDDGVVLLLKSLGAAFDEPALRALPRGFEGWREYEITQRYAWGEER